MQVSKNTVVTIAYTLRDQEEQILDQADEQRPLAYVHGVGAAIPGLENALEGKSPGDSLQVEVTPDQAYGEHSEDLVSDVPLNLFEGVDEVQTGMQFQAEAEDGTRIITVIDVQGETVTIDANHPLAGVTLNFDVEVKNVRDATEEEVEHGHAHEGGSDIVH